MHNLASFRARLLYQEILYVSVLTSTRKMESIFPKHLYRLQSSDVFLLPGLKGSAVVVTEASAQIHS